MSNAETTRVTYVELARARGITVAAARRLTQRHKWPKQIGNDGFTHVVVPTSMLAAWDGDTYDDSRVKSNDDAYDDAGVNGNVSSRLKGSDACNGLDVDIRVKEGLKNSEICDDTDVSSRTIPADVYDDTTRPRKSAVDPATVRAIADATADVWADLWADATADTRSAMRVLEEAVISLREQLATERLLRANDKERAEQRTREAETRVKEVEEQLQTEMVEHRRVVGLLAEQLAARRSWWPWRRR